MNESNSMVAKLLGEDVPVPAGARQSENPRNKANRASGVYKNLKTARQRSRAVAGVLGVMEDDTFPANAQEIENTGGTPRSMARMNPIKEIVAEPTDPYSNGEKVYSPATALVAPDVTPNATKPLDPSRMPGVNFQTFKGAQAAPPAAPSPVPGAAPNGTPQINAMDILLGRSRGSAATTSPSTLERTDDLPVTAESAAAMMGVSPALFTAAPVMEAGVPQPPPPPRTDIKQTCDVARRWMR